ncbi:hypothetical protein [Paenibacillus sp. XY044]|uniref:hypothetical protein n=1 Tax=Paenibacillus sp. XY044 TaxID=2026089 RepID=UPI000B985CD2|nr:hypothetical protein [Paenibacillus sp. XY044]OZB98106.1 hypothetical protein CJP46_02760 [Paenibacillus sp. XY044]
MSLDTFYISSVQQKKKGHMTEYETVLNEVFGRVISWEEFKNSDRKLQARVMLKLDEVIKLNESPIDIKKLAYAIQHSRSGVGGCAMTEFECKFCGKEELWGNTNTPGICKDCATNMAKNIAKYNYNIYKEDIC